ncbi:hypothetical protein ACFLXD_03345 [Chloroflexota bacterium]
MNKVEKYYSIHGIVTFKVVAENLPRRLKMEYTNFESDTKDNPDFTVYLGKFTPDKEGCQVLDAKYLVKHDYFYTEDSYKMGRWRLELTGLEKGNLVVRLHTNVIGTLLADMFICARVIDPLISFVMNVKGYSTVHAAAVSKNGEAYLFPSQSGAGKTTTAAYFTQDGFDFLGDDFVILHQGKILSYLTPLNIFGYNLNAIVRAKVGTVYRAIIRLKNLLYKTTAGYIKIFSKLNPKDFFATSTESGLKAVYFLVQGEKLSVNIMSRAELLSRLFINWEMEFYPFNRYMLEYAYAFPDSNIAHLFERYQEKLSENLPENLHIFRVEVPKKYTRDTFETIKRAVNKEG